MHVLLLPSQRVLLAWDITTSPSQSIGTSTLGSHLNVVLRPTRDIVRNEVTGVGGVENYNDHSGRTAIRTNPRLHVWAEGIAE